MSPEPAAAGEGAAAAYLVWVDDDEPERTEAGPGGLAIAPPELTGGLPVALPLGADIVGWAGEAVE